MPPAALRPTIQSEPRIGPAPTLETAHRNRIPIALLVLLTGLGILAWYWETTVSMVSTWQHSGTFAHGFLVFPISLYLVWRCRHDLANIAPAPFWPGLILVSGAGFAWLLGETGSVISISQFAVVAMVPLVVWTTLGTRIVVALQFPLAFLIFAVPFGEFLLPIMMNWTADFTVLALRFSGVPVFREGNNFAIPSGYWSVVEACSGVRYLIASMMVGSLFAYLNFRSWRRQAGFFAMSIVVPLFANWLRAYIIVMLGHLSNNAIATGVDHLIYGWVFFGLVMLMMFWIGSNWRDKDFAPSAELKPRGSSTHSTQQPTALPRPADKIFAALMAVFVAAAIWKPIEPILNSSRGPSLDGLAKVMPSNGWVDAGAPVVDWRPHYGGASAELLRTFAKGNSHVGMYLAFYRNQSQGNELISSLNSIAPTADKHWLRGTEGKEIVAVGGRNLEVRSTEIRGASHRLLVWNWYWVDGRLTSNDYIAKAYLVWAKLHGRSDDSAIVALYTTKDQYEDESRGTLESFVAGMWPNIDDALRTSQGL